MIQIKDFRVFAFLMFLVLSGCREKPEEEPEVINYGNLTGKIAFGRGLDGTMIIIDFDNKTKTTITLNKNKPVWESFISLSPDGKTLAFAWLNDSGYMIHTLAAIGGTTNQLTVNNTAIVDHNTFPVWSDDGTQLFYINGGAFGGPVRSMTSNGGDNLLITDFNVSGRVSVSRDGSFMILCILPLLQTDPRGVYLYDIQNQTLSPLKLLGESEVALCPVLSPDETKIAYVVRHGWNEAGTIPYYFNFMTMNIDGTDEITVKTLPFNNYYSSAYVIWSPDGSRLAFNCNETGDVDWIHIYSIKTDGTDLIQITSSSDYDGAPSWVE